MHFALTKKTGKLGHSHLDIEVLTRNISFSIQKDRNTARAWVLPYIGYTGICRWKGYGFQAIYSGIGSTNHRKLV